MNRKDEIRRFVALGKEAVNQGTTVAGRVARKVSAEAARQAKIARPIVEDASRKAWAELQRQTAVAKPVIRQAAQRGMKAAKEKSRDVVTAIRTAVERNAPAIRQLLHRSPWLRKASLACAASLMPVLLFAGLWGAASLDRAQKPLVVNVNQSGLEPLLQAGSVNPISNNETGQHASSLTDVPAPPPSNSVSSQRANELAQLRQQAQFELDQAETDYNNAVQQWNAEVAACQAGLPQCYSPQQMGRFAAMGVRMQPRQPNQALLYAALQAEQRYLQVRDKYQRLVNAQ